MLIKGEMCQGTREVPQKTTIHVCNQHECLILENKKYKHAGAAHETQRQNGDTMKNVQVLFKQDEGEFQGQLGLLSTIGLASINHISTFLIGQGQYRLVWAAILPFWGMSGYVPGPVTIQSLP